MRKSILISSNRGNPVAAKAKKLREVGGIFGAARAITKAIAAMELRTKKSGLRTFFRKFISPGLF